MAADQFGQALAILRNGGVIAYPTDTVYGLGADAWNAQAVARIYRLKGRSVHQPLPLLLADEGMLSSVAESLSDAGRALADRFWPGGLTLVLPKTASLPSWLAPGDTIAVRIPASAAPVGLIRGLGRPLIGTSANLSGARSPVDAQEVRRQLGDRVDLILDGGPCPGGIESTVVDVTSDPPRVLRLGKIGRDELLEVCPLLE